MAASSSRPIFLGFVVSQHSYRSLIEQAIRFANGSHSTWVALVEGCDWPVPAESETPGPFGSEEREALKAALAAIVEGDVPPWVRDSGAAVSRASLSFQSQRLGITTWCLSISARHRVRPLLASSCCCTSSHWGVIYAVVRRAPDSSS